MTRPAFVIGRGTISAIGNSVEESWASLQSSVTGIGKTKILDTIHADLPMGEVHYSNAELIRSLNTNESLPRASLLGIMAARESIKGIDLTPWRTGLISGITVGGMDLTESFFPDYLTDPTSGKLKDVTNHACGSITTHIADDLGITDFVSTINTACSSSANALITATRLIAAGELDIVIAGGTESITKFTLNGFNSLMILDKQPCRPFDRDRKGLNLGEGAGYLVLASEAVVAALGKDPLCYLSGYGNTNDAFHQTASSPDGVGSYLAMKSSLSKASLQPQEISYINMHGTGTANNDLSEGKATKKLFGASPPPFSSTKGMTGHTLGASGGIEAVFASLGITHQCMFANKGFSTPIPEIDIYPITEFKAGTPIKHVLSNSFGFGGNCSSIVLSAT